MNKFLIVLGVFLLYTPAVLAYSNQMITDASDHPHFSREYSNEDGKFGLPPGPGSPDSTSTR